MWECLVVLSTWVENNSGQIQIFIGVVAIYYVLRQIRISNDQRIFDLRIKSIEYLKDATTKIQENYDRYPKVLVDVDLVLQRLKEVNSDDLNPLNTIRNKIQKTYESQYLIINKANNFINQIKSDKNISIQFLEEKLLDFTKLEAIYLKELSNIKEMLECIEELKKMNNISE